MFSFVLSQLPFHCTWAASLLLSLELQEVAQDWWEINRYKSKSCIVNKGEVHYMLSYSASALKMRKGLKNTTVAFLLSWFCHGEGKQNPLKHGRRIRKREYKASRKYLLLPFHSMLNTFALMAPHLQPSGSFCARSSSSQRSRLWLSCPLLPQTWA